MLEHKIYVVFSFLSGPVVGIFGGAGPPVLRGMMSKIVSSDDQGKLTLSGNREQNGSKFSLPQLIPIIPLQSTCSISQFYTNWAIYRALIGREQWSIRVKSMEMTWCWRNFKGFFSLSLCLSRALTPLRRQSLQYCPVYATKANKLSGKSCYCTHIFRRKNILTVWYFVLVASCSV